MIKKHRNAIFETIRQCGLDPARFQVKDSNPGGFPSKFTLILKDTPFSFGIDHKRRERIEVGDYQPDIYEVSYVGYALYVGETMPSPTMGLRSFDDVLSHLNSWAESIAEYLYDKQTSDLWTQLEATSPLISDSPTTSDDTSEFTEEEKKMLRQGVQTYRLLVTAEFKPNEEQAKAINDKLDYLEKAIDRLNRFDWKALALSTVIGIGINLTVDTEMGKRLFQLFAQAFNEVIKLLPGL